MVSVEEEIRARERDVWERARRNPRYIARCKRLKFDNDGYHIDIKEPLFRGEIRIVQFSGKSGVVVHIDPCKEYEDIIKEGPLYRDGNQFSIAFDDWGKFPAVQPVFVGNTLSYFLRDAKFLTLEIDITQENKVILSEVITWVKEFRNLAGVAIGKGGETFRKRFEYYEIWDQRKSQRSFKEIALGKKKYREEPFEKAVDRIKKQYYKAYALIVGRRYNRKIWTKLLPSKKKGGHLLLVPQIDYGGHSGSIAQDLSSDPEVRILLRDIHRSCKACNDAACRDIALKSEFWEPCPKILELLNP